MSTSGGNLNWRSSTPQSLPVLHATTSALQANQECIERKEYKSTVGTGGSDSMGKQPLSRLGRRNLCLFFHWPKFKCIYDVCHKEVLVL